MSMNVFVRDLDLRPFNHLDGRRLEVVADGLSLFGWAQLAIDTTLVSALRRDCTAREAAANRNGVAIRSAHRRKERTLLGWSSLPARLAGVGRPRQRTSCGLWQLRRIGMFPTFCKPASRLLGSAVGQTSSHVQQRALSLISLLEVRGAGGAGGNAPSSHDVVWDNRFRQLQREAAVVLALCV